MATPTIPAGYKLVPDVEGQNVPEGRGRAEAMRTFLAQGGGLDRSGRYRKGPMRGKTVQEATTMFEDRWAGASDGIKDKYAARARDILAPSEKREAGVTVATPQRNLGQQGNRMKQLEDQKISRIRMYQGDAGVEAYKKRTAAKPAPPVGEKGSIAQGSPKSAMAKPAASGDQSQAAMGTPEQQAQVQAMMNEGQDFATASTNNSDMAAAIAMDKYKGRPVSAPVEKTPIESAIDSAVDANTRFWDRTTKAVNSAIMAPFTPESERIVGAESEAARRTLEAKKAADEAAAQKRLTAENAEKLRKERGLPTPTPATTPQVTPPTLASPTGSTPSQRSANIAAAGGDMSKLATDDRLAAQRAAGNTTVNKAAPATSVTPVRINRLTGLPFGARPGETAGLDSAQKATADRMAADRAAQGTPTARPIDIAAANGAMREQGMVPSMPRTVTTPVRQPAQKPAVDPVVQRQGEAFARFKQMEANPSRVNPTGLRLVGPKRPLDELVRRQKLIPARA